MEMLGDSGGHFPRREAYRTAVMISVMKIGHASNTCYLDGPGDMEESEKTTDCPSMRFVTSPKQASPGEIFHTAMETLTVSGSDTIGGVKQEFLNASPRHFKTKIRNGCVLTARVCEQLWRPLVLKKSDGSAGQNEQALGRSRGGFGTKIHASITPMGHPATIKLTGSEANDSPHLPDVITGHETTAVIADQNAQCVIPSKTNRKVKIEYDHHLYKERYVVECYFGKLKRYRRVATRYDKKAQNFLGFFWLASVNMVLL